MRGGGWGHNGKEAERLVEHKSFQGREGVGFPLFFHGEKRRMGHFPIPTEANRGKRRSPFFPLPPFWGKTWRRAESEGDADFGFGFGGGGSGGEAAAM